MKSRKNEINKNIRILQYRGKFSFDKRIVFNSDTFPLFGCVSSQCVPNFFFYLARELFLFSKKIESTIAYIYVLMTQNINFEI